jgi:NAD(P)H-hydrate repair Nnr-like enzyme with NAD(P)H-hydrate dehydratase domain
VGTIPEADCPLLFASFSVIGGGIDLGPYRCAVNRGTPAMLAAAWLSYTFMRAEASPADMYVLAAGDTGKGQGSRQVYQRLVEILPELCPRGITFHYLLPDVDWHNRILISLDGLAEQPLLVADAGYMYAAKMSGYAASYDLFTPDIGELAFLADEAAPHPFYTRNFLLADEERADELIADAYAAGNAARHMLVKGRIDRYAHNGAIVEKVDSPDVPMMEPIGGTGDTLTGIVSALLASGIDMRAACTAAFSINRRMGLQAAPTPASSVMHLVTFLPSALQALRMCLATDKLRPQ